MLHYRYTYAELSVYLCCTFGIPMLNHRYQDAILFWYRYSKVFTMAKIRNIRVVVIHFFEDKTKQLPHFFDDKNW